MSIDGVPKRPLISPLRYPGGKGALYGMLRGIVRANDLTNGTYVEPYAGGAGAAMALLITGQVERIAINDLDPTVYAFWQAVVRYPSKMIRLIQSVNVTVEEWERQKTAYMSAPRDDYVTLGFATFFLNRTNRSGALNGGPIGGMDQRGNYSIDARFNKDALAERVRLIGLHASRIAVTNLDGLDIIQEHSKQSATLIYADPPYFHKSGTLYMNSFKKEDHQRLADCLNQQADKRWLLTYDDRAQVERLYAERRRGLVALNYSAHKVAKAHEVMVVSDRLVLPDSEAFDPRRSERSASEWGSPRDR